MKRLVLLCAFIVAGCTHAGQIILKAGQCVLDSGVLGSVMTDLASASYVTLIADLATKVGPTVVTCALSAIAAENSGSGSATPAIADDVHSRARYLLANPSLWQK